MLREADAGTVAESAKKHGVSKRTIYLWRKRFGQLEQESARLEKLVAERDLELETMKEINAKNGKRAGVFSARRACALSRSTPGYCLKMARKAVRAPMQELAGQYPRFGYRRIQVFLEQLGLQMSTNRACRIWSAAGFQVHEKRPRRRIACSRPWPRPRTESGRMTPYSMPLPTGSNGSV